MGRLSKKVAYLESQIKSAGYTTDTAVISDNMTMKNYTRMLTVQDRILCSRRYTWNGLPANITSAQLESFFYENGALCFYKEDNMLKFSRFATVGKLEPYGRLNQIIPIDFAGKSHSKKFTVINTNGSLPTEKNIAVIISDYTNTYSEIGSIPSRMEINTLCTVADEANVYKQLKTGINLAVKKALALCDNEDQRKVVTKELEKIFYSDNGIIPIVRNAKNGVSGINLPLEIFNLNTSFDTQNYCQQIDFYNKERRIFNGLPTPPPFEKRERMTVGETSSINTDTNAVLLDGLDNRTEGCRLIKEHLGFNLSVKVSDILIKAIESTEENPKEVDYGD